MLDPNWKARLLTSYTAIAFYVVIALVFLPDLIFFAFGIDTNPLVWSALLALTAILGLLGRVVLQPKAGAWRRRFIIGVIVLVTLSAAIPALAQTTERQTMAVLVPLVVKWEGEHRCADNPAMHCAYLDIVGVATLCYGETRGVELGDRATDQQCLNMLKRRLSLDFREGLHRSFTTKTKETRLTPERDAAYVSLAYNVGIYGAGRSTATRRLNAGNIAGGCRAIGWWNKAGGRVVRGLVNRRAEEVALCLRGS
ncbi:MAG: lysozyme [Pseudomonadota bacterium]